MGKYYSETTLSAKIYFETPMPIFLYKPKIDPNPHTISTTLSLYNSGPTIAYLTVTMFFDARDHP